VVVVKESIKKADILIEAIPYLKAFKGKIVVIKYGGSAMNDINSRQSLLKDIIFMNTVGIRPMLIHGGGPAISQKLKQLGKNVKFVHGKRVTDEHTMKVVDRILSNINKNIMQEIVDLGGNAKQLLAKRNNLILAKCTMPQLGFVGEPVSLNVRFLNRILGKGFIPVISSVAKGYNGNKIYNINADDVATFIAGSLKAEKLVLFTNVEGILKDKGDDRSLLSTLSVNQAQRLIDNGTVSEGMIPKVKACIEALRAGVKKAHIIGAYVPHSLLLEIFTRKGIGTEIVRD
jgi:acetylglutamate kinase